MSPLMISARASLPTAGNSRQHRHSPLGRMYEVTRAEAMPTHACINTHTHTPLRSHVERLVCGSCRHSLLSAQGNEVAPRSGFLLHALRTNGRPVFGRQAPHGEEAQFTANPLELPGAAAFHSERLCRGSGRSAHFGTGATSFPVHTYIVLHNQQRLSM